MSVEKKKSKAKKTKPADAPAKSKKTAKPKAEKKAKSSKPAAESMASKAKGFIKEAGKDGITAEALGRKLGLVKKTMEPADRTSALKTVRVLARKAGSGPAEKRDGRTAVYTA